MAAPPTRLMDVNDRVRAIGSVTPFTAWPLAALLRLAQSSRALTYPAGAMVVTGGRKADQLFLVFDGTVQASVTAPGGRRVTFRLDSTSRVYGMIPLVDGREIPNDLTAVEPVSVIAIPHAAIHAELEREPALWQSIAVEAGGRARAYTEQMKRFVFDTPRIHMAALLVGLAESRGRSETGRVEIGLRLPQERLAEMLGVSRQWAVALVREMTDAGLVEWRYGRVSVLDLQGLRAIAEEGVNAWASGSVA